ncbi:MAG: valine--tRNA ligase [Ilumatobacteraceae bacterium]
MSSTDATTPHVPDKPTLDGLDVRWGEHWQADGTYAFDRNTDRDAVFSIDTPPPTVSGSLHVGHVFSYTHTDTVARFQRMRGRNVFYPIGWDDNGLATERRVQNFFGVRCDPSLPFDPAFEPPAKPDPKNQVPVSRPNFVELCKRLVADDEVAFEELFRRLGLSVDWDYLYTTIGDETIRTSQAAFLRNLARGEAYQHEAPTLWDVDFRTAVAQAELVDKELPGAYHKIAFARVTGSEGSASDEPHGGSGESERSERTPVPSIVIDTTRPELIASCCALVAHPDDARYQPLFGTTVVTPLYGVEVPVVAHELAEPDKGTGIAMICTFGDVTDVTWWRELDLPTRTLIGRDGRFSTAEPAWIPAAGQQPYAAIAGKTAKQAQAIVVEQLRESGALQGEPRPIQHPVKFYEKGDRPLEIVASRQWYIRNGGRSAELRATFLRLGEELRFHPDHMRHRYSNWVEGLNGDWLISRQRFFGVPFPVWYPVDADGEPVYDQPILPDEAALPIDPSTDVPAGYTAEQRNQPGGFAGDGDVMDTWATSSLTPQVAGRWLDDPGLFARVFPMDVRPQAHDIIRTWLFATVVRAHYEHGSLPWFNAAISGWILDPDRKKMSKSVGNVVTPLPLIDQYGADAVRYWGACARPGVDTAFDEGQMKIGRKLANKLLNASKFVLAAGAAPDGATPTAAVDLAMLARLDEVVDEATRAFDEYDYARALERTEGFFWWFCDDYVELVKGRGYGSQGDAAAASARAGLRLALGTLHRLFAPFLPFVTEEVWSWWQAGSVHRAAWPAPALLSGDAGLLEPVSAILSTIRRAKTDAKVSQRAAVERVDVGGPPAVLDALAAAESDLRDAGSVASFTTTAAEQLTCVVVLAMADGDAPA